MLLAACGVRLILRSSTEGITAERAVSDMFEDTVGVYSIDDPTLLLLLLPLPDQSTPGVCMCVCV